MSEKEPKTNAQIEIDLRNQLLEHTTSIVLATIQGQDVDQKAIPELIKSVYQTLLALSKGEGDKGAKDENLVPAVHPKKSVFPDYIICLEDGKKLKLLRRHLKTTYNLTPEAYREKWGLPANYPMVAPSYAERRSKLAKNIGLGKRGEKK